MLPPSRGSRSLSLLLVLLLLLLPQRPRASSSSIIDCCSLSDENEGATAVLRCVNDTLAAGEQASFAAGAPYLSAAGLAQGPSLSVVLLTRATEAIYPYAAWSLLLQAQYARRNGYTLLPLPGPGRESTTPDYALYRKLAPMLEALEGPAFHCDYLVWLDADLVVLDWSLRVEQVAAAHPQAHILISADVSAVANTGMIVVRNTAWALRFLQDWLALHATPGVATDQLGFTILHQRRPAAEMQTKVAILPPHVLNSDAPPMGRQLPQHQVLHLAAESTALRRAVFLHGAREACRALQAGPHAVPAAQLGLSRLFLQRASQDVYRHATLALLAKIDPSSSNSSSSSSSNSNSRKGDTPAKSAKPSKRAAKAGNPPAAPGSPTMSTADLATLRQSASKLSYALAYENGERETEESVALRLRVHALVSAWVAALPAYAAAVLATGVSQGPPRAAKKTNSRASSAGAALAAAAAVTPRERDEFPEQLKLAAELAFDALHSVSPQHPQHSTIAAFISSALDLLAAAVSPAFAHIVLDMKVGLWGHLGEAALMQGLAGESRRLLLLALGCYSAMDGLADPNAPAPASASASAALRASIAPAELTATPLGQSSSSSSSSSSSGAQAQEDSALVEALISSGQGLGRGDVRGRLRSMGYLAGALCMLGQHGLGGRLFARVLQLEADHVGPSHTNLADKYVNAAICLREGVHAGLSGPPYDDWWEVGRGYLERAGDILGRHPDFPNAPALMEAVKREMAVSRGG